METVQVDDTVTLHIPETTLELAPPTTKFECKDRTLGGCEGKMRATGHGLHCTKHYNLRAEEWGKFTVSDEPDTQGNDDYARRHPKSRSRKTYGGKE